MNGQALSLKPDGLSLDLSKTKNITWFEGSIFRKDREILHGHEGAVIWGTGIPAPYEKPVNLNMAIHSDKTGAKEDAEHVIKALKAKR